MYALYILWKGRFLCDLRTYKHNKIIYDQKTNIVHVLVYQDDTMLQHVAELKDVPYPTWQSTLLHQPCLLLCSVTVVKWWDLFPS